MVAERWLCFSLLLFLLCYFFHVFSVEKQIKEKLTQSFKFFLEKM